MRRLHQQEMTYPMMIDFTSVTRATDEYKTIFTVLKNLLDVATLLGADPVSVQVSFESINR
jgi:hypothetical protein